MSIVMQLGVKNLFVLFASWDGETFKLIKHIDFLGFFFPLGFVLSVLCSSEITRNIAPA